MGLDVVLATDRCHHLEDPWGDNALPVRFEDPDAGARSLASRVGLPDGIIAVGDRPTVIAARTAERLGIPYHSVESAEFCRNKFSARERFRAAGLPAPEYFRVPVTAEPSEVARGAKYPCVLKPLGLSGSRGVIRANDELDFVKAFERIHNLLDLPDIRRLKDAGDRFIQIESFIGGAEYSVEGVVTHGELQIFTVFDKPDPLDGPFFEETIYVTPSRAGSRVITAIEDATKVAVRALGLTHGPVHAEMRYSDRGVWMMEVAARPIGGLCSQSLRFDGGATLEHILIRHALGEDVRGIPLESRASGVMMIPIPESGIYTGVSGIEEASAVGGIEAVTITAKQGQRLLKLPEGASYLGFLFARSDSPEQVERALRTAHERLTFDIAKELDVVRQRPA
jgi:hypothetical protein